MRPLTAYLVLDLVNDLIDPAGKLGTAPFCLEVVRRNVLVKTAEALARARAAGVIPVFVRPEFSVGYPEAPRHSPLFRQLAEIGAFTRGSWGSSVHDLVRPLPDETDIAKHRIGAFSGTPLDALLRGAGIERLFISGVSTNFVVTTTVRQAHDLDYSVSVIEDCCSASSEAEHQAALDGFSPLCSKICRAEATDFT